MISRSAVAVLVLILAFALVPSVDAPSATRLIAATAPPASLRIGSLQTVDSLNPFIGINDASYLLYGLLYDYPLSFDQDGNFVSNLIVSASCDASCMNWTYQVRQGVHWSDGTGLTANDVAFTWNYTSQNLAYLWAFEPYFNQVVQCSPSTQPYCGASITSPWNVTVYFDRPFAAGRSLFAPILEEAQWSGITPRHAQTTYANPNPIGTGPFIADPNIYGEWLNQTSVPIHVYRNAQYHPVGSHTGSSYIADIYLYYFSDVNSMVLALEAGNIDLAQMTTAAIQVVRGLPNIVTQTPLQAIQQWNEIGISQIDTSAADNRLNPARFDRNVRLAMAHATNKDYIVQQLYSGQGARGDSLVSPITPQWWYDPVTGGDNLTFDVSQANAILDTTGWNGTWSDGTGTYRLNPSPITVSYQTACYQCLDPPNVTKTIPAGTHLQFLLGVRPTSQFPEETATAYYLAAQYAQIGIKVVIKVETTENALASDVYGGYLDMYIWYWSADQDPNYILSMESSWTLDGWNDNYWNNATYNHRYLDQLADQNVTQRITDVKEAQRIQYESATYLIYIYPFGQWAMRTDLWQGWGDWSAHPYRQMNAYWGANPLWFDLNCPTCAGANQPPTAPVISGPGSVYTFTNVTLNFTATTSDPEPGDQLNWTWTWGDGNSTLTTSNASEPTSTAGHAWTMPGNYTVNVTVTDGYNSPVAAPNPVYVNVVPPSPGVGWVAGVVRDSGGTPIVGAQVYSTPGNATTSTNSAGVYNLSLPAGTYNVTATAPLYVSQTKAAVVVNANTTSQVNFVLVPNVGRFVGSVSDSVTGLPIWGAIILATSQSNANYVTSTDSQGDYNLTVEPGTYWLNVTASGYGSGSASGLAVAQDETVISDFALTPNQIPVQASLSGQTGRPGQAMRISGIITATGSGNWTLRFGDGASVAANYIAGSTPVSESHTYAAEGTYTLQLFATTGTDTQVATATALVDGTAPTTTASLAGSAGNASWYRSSVQVTLTATDAMSGVASTFYRIDGGSWRAYTAAFSVSGDGNHTVEYNSTDVAGNMEATKTTSVHIDATGPTAAASLAGTAGANGWYTSAVTVTLHGSDSMSGVAGFEYRVDAGTWQAYAGTVSLADGQHTISYFAIDVAGNAGSVGSTQVSVDTLGPAITIVAPAAGTTVTSSDVAVNWSAADAGSGVASVQISIDNGSFATVTGTSTTLHGLADGSHTVTLKVTDQAGNAATRSVTFTVQTAILGGLSPLVIGSVAVLIVVVAAVAILLLRRRKRTKPKGPDEEGG